MQIDSMGFIGGGRVARIMLAALGRAGKLPGRVVVSDVDNEVLGRLHGEFSVIQHAGRTTHSLQ